MDTRHYLRYWGKAGAAGEFHLLAYHALDVAACGKTLLERHAPLRHLLRARLGLAEAMLCAWLTFMLALHDTGKLSYRFQRLRQDFPGLEPNPSLETQYHPRHDTLGAILWFGRLERTVMDRFVAEPARSRQTRTALRFWMGTAVGHHGQPPKPGQARPEGLFTAADQQAAEALCIDAGTLLLDGCDRNPADAKAFAAAIKPTSWWLAGIAVLCDWLGSNRDLFPFVADETPLAAYWNDHALPAAARAIEHSGVLPIASTQRTQQGLFSYLARPTPLQKLATELELRPSPRLLILEDVTGDRTAEGCAVMRCFANVLVAAPPRLMADHSADHAPLANFDTEKQDAA